MDGRVFFARDTQNGIPDIGLLFPDDAPVPVAPGEVFSQNVRPVGQTDPNSAQLVCDQQAVHSGTNPV